MPDFRLDARPRPHLRPEKLEYDLVRARALAKAAWEKGEALAKDGDFAAAVAWLGRAHRIATGDQNILFSLAWLHLRAGDAAGAASLFADLAWRHGTRECFGGWIAALRALGQHEAAAAAAQQALANTAADPALALLAAGASAEASRAGWCGLAEDGALLTDAPPAALRVTCGGAPVTLRPLGQGRYRLRLPSAPGPLFVQADGEALLGSPLEPQRIFRLEGFAARGPRGVAGWAWHPAAPGRKPVLRLTDMAGTTLARRMASRPLDEVDHPAPLARPRAFAFKVPPDQAVRVLGPDGADLLGSPVATDPLPPPPAPRRRPRRAGDLPADLPVDVVIPIYRGLDTTQACLDSVLRTVPPDTCIWVVNDASPEPALVDAMRRLAENGAIRLIEWGEGAANRGFPAAVNAGIRAAKGRHVVLLNSDTLVAPGWLKTLRAACCSAADIGTATPISNEASILSYPGEAGKNPVPDLAETERLARLAAAANRGRLVEIPTANGFCMFIRRDCLEQTGLFEEHVFAQGYGEENDFCERARGLGWRHVAVPQVFVAHLGGASFGAGRLTLLRRNLTLLEQRHPGYAARVESWIAADPMIPSRRRLDAARWRLEGRMAADGAAAPGYLLVSHGGGGGTSRVVAERVAALARQGFRPIVLKAADGLCEIGGYPNLRFALPGEFAALRRLLAEARPVAGELHHLLGHHHSVVDLFAALNIPYEAWIHDYAWFCPRLSFVTGEGRFCGEAEPAVCDGCVARWGSEIEEDIGAAALRRRSAADLRGARAVIVPSADVARRVARHVPGVDPVIRPWESEALFKPAKPVAPRAATRVAVIGAIGIDKGFDVLLACARDAAARRLKLEFVVIGFTVNDEALLETNRVFITGMFASDEAVPLIRAQAADLAFLPSIWPETWCYALSDAWAGGLPAAVFDIGTPPLRVRAAGRGWVLPLGLPAPRVNDALISLAMINPRPSLSRAI